MENRAVLFYKEKLSVLLKAVKEYNQINKYIAAAKLASFIISVVLPIIWYFNHSFNIAFLFIAPVIFILLIIFGQKYINLYEYYNNQYSYVNDELSYINKDFTVFRTSNEYIDYNHDFSYDLDIFEQGSLYHSLNRCSTIEGESLLRKYILNPARTHNEITEYQDAVKEMIPLRDLSCEIAAVSYKAPCSLNKLKDAFNVNSNPVKKHVLILSYISVFITLTSLVLYGFSIIPSIVPLGLFMFQFAVSSIYTKKTNDEYGKINKADKASKAYMQICRLIANADFKSKLMVELKQKLAEMENKITELQKISAEFDQRNSGLYLLLSNGFFLKDIMLSYKINKWLLENKDSIQLWSDTVAHIDVINSISIYAFNNDDFVFPEINNNVILKAENLAHPSLNRDKRVGNDIAILSLNKFFIITGANMAGKSTFIRSIAVNLILASMGAPVCAKSLQFQPVHIFSSMRTSDKLMESSSYFHAELQRLKFLKEKASKGEKILILLDEILKGTNSQDKLKGSRLVLLKFIEYNMAGILATHDTALGELQQEYKNNFENYYFDFSLDESGEMIFDYKLKKGVSKNMNASILIEKVLKD